MPKTAVSPNFEAHQLGLAGQNDKYYSDKTSGKKKQKKFKKMINLLAIKFCPLRIFTQNIMLN